MKGKGPPLDPEEEPPLLLLHAPVPAPPGRRNVRDLHILSISFLFIFLAYGAIQNLESSLNSDEGLGSISLGLLYISLTLFSTGAPIIVKWLGSKYGILVGLIGYWIFMLANLFPSWYTLIPASVFLGFTAAVLWVAQGTYITFAAKAHAAETKLDEVGVIGKFNGVFWGFFATHQIFGNLLSLLLLKVDEGSTSAESSSTTWPLILTFLGSLFIGTLLASLLGRQEHVPRSNQALKESPFVLNTSLGILTQERMLLLLPLFIYSGLEQAFIWDDFTTDIITPALGISWIGGVMAAYGASDAVCSLMAGQISSSISSAFILLFTAGITQLSALIYLAFKQSYGSDLEGYATIFCWAIVWGIGDAIVISQTSALLGTLFPLDTEAAFGQWKIWQSLATASIFILTSLTTFSVNLVLLLIMLPISAISLCILRYTILNSAAS